MTHTAEDGRIFPFFQVDNALIDKFGPVIGPYGIAVYCVIVRHVSQKSGVAFPSIKTIARESGMSIPRAQKSVNLLKTQGLIGVKATRRDDNGNSVNHYTIVNVEPLTPHLTSLNTPPCNEVKRPPFNDVESNKTNLFNKTEDSPAREAAPDAPRYAVGQRVVLHTGETGRVAEVRQRGEPATPEYQIVLDEGGPRWCAAGDVAWPAPSPVPPAPPADPPTPPTPKRGRASKTKPADHKPRADDPLFDLIAQRSFGIDPRGPDVKPLGKRIGMLKGIATSKAYDVVKLQAAYDWYKKHRKGCTSPRGVPAFTNMLNDYDAAHKPRFDDPPALQFDPDAVFDITPRVWRPRPAGVSA